VSGVEIQIAPASAETHELMASWRYPPPYDFYDGDAEPVRNPERFYAALDEKDQLVGFYYFESNPPDLDYGLGLRPDLTGQGLGLEFFCAGLAYAQKHFQPRRVLLHVADFNKRAVRVYERAGFRLVSSQVRTFDRLGEVEFLTMAKSTDDVPR